MKNKKLKLIKEVLDLPISRERKLMFATLISEFDLFLKIKKRHPNEGLLKACRRQFGFSFTSMYGIHTLEDVVKIAKGESL